MANYEVPENPTYDANIRKLEDTDPASASTIFNPLIQQLVTNTHAVKKAVDDLSDNTSGIEDSLEKYVELGTDGKIPSTQIPDLDYIKTAQKGKASGVASLDTTGKVPNSQLPSLDYIPTSEKGKPNGVAVLDAAGKIPGAVLGSVGVPPQIIVTVASGSAVTCSQGSTTLTATSNGKATFNLTDYGTWVVTATLNGKTATGSVVVNEVKQYSLALEYFTATLVVNADSGATVTVMGPESHTATATSAGTATFTVEKAGTYTVKATKGSDTSETVSVAITTNNKTYTADCLFFKSTLASNTWAQIAKASETGKASSLWSVGDEINITVSGETLTLVIMDFNHDDLASGGKAGITFGLKNLMKDTRQMNSSNTNSGGFTGSAMYTWLQNTLLKALPSDLQAVIKSVNKKTSAGNQATTINTNAMKLFLFSEAEVFGTTTYSVAGEGTQYGYFATAATRIKKLANGTGSAHNWCERSPHSSSSTNFCLVNSDGSANLNSASNAYGVCFGFCV